MMNRINQLFLEKNAKLLSIYFTAGYPNINDTATIIKLLSSNHVDMIEIGIPFSDPIADGPTIQESNQIALQNGMSISLLFEQLKKIRKETQIPLILMSYLNPILKYGIEAFCKNAHQCGIDGFIIPDLPMTEYQIDFKEIFEKYEMKFIFLITPQTSKERMQLIDNQSDSFIYMVTSNTVTGSTNVFTQAQIKPMQYVQSAQLRNPVMAGFGINNHEDFNIVTQYVNGAIVGSSFLRALKDSKDTLENKISTFIKSIKQ